MKKLKDYTAEELQQLSHEQYQEILRQEQIERDKRPYETFTFVTEGSTSKQGGIVHVKEREHYVEIVDKRVAVVGDYVVYPDGTTAEFISGCGCATLMDNLPLIIKHSALDNGDTIEDDGILYKGCEIHIYEGDPVPEGFLVEHWAYTEAQ